MRDFVIISDSTTDLPADYCKKHDLHLIRLSYMLDGHTYKDGEGLSMADFYKKVREGAMPTTSQVNPETAKEELLPFVKKGLDILYIAFSSGLSGTYQSVRLAGAELEEEFEDVRIEVVDSLSASLGEGLLVHKAIQLKEQGRSLDDILTWLEENKLNLCHNFTVADLFHLHRGGRVSKATAIVGTLINIKPLLHVDDEGHLINIGKIRGRKKSLNWLVNRMADQIQGFDNENDWVFISHGDCLDEAEYVADLVRERFGIKNILINYVGSVIGSHSGPGTMALFFMGSPR